MEAKNAADASSANKLLSESQLLKLATEIFEERQRSELERQVNDNDEVNKDSRIKKKNPSLLDNFEEGIDKIDKSRGKNYCQVVKSCAICIATIGIAFGIFANVIFAASKSRSNGTNIIIIRELMTVFLLV